MMNLDDALQHYFGFNQFNAGQKEVIEHLVARHSAAALFPTGGGKSLCYQLPALLLPGLTLVVSPLIALMKDQIDALTLRGIKAARLDATLTSEEYHDTLTQAKNGSLKLLYVAPERFNNERFRGVLQQLTISLFAIDEAHCISEWGHNFRPDYLKLPYYAKQCGADRILALTATATAQVQQDICSGFGIATQNVVCTGFYRPNLTILTTPTVEDLRDEMLMEKLKKRPRGSSIVYVTLQRTAEKVAERLIEYGLPARAYHAGMKNELRATVQDWFMASDEGIVIATMAFGMGVDKSNIRYVYHYNLPKSLENFAQEIGRAGRDGKKSTCEILVCLDDLNTLQNFIYGDTPTQAAMYSFVNEIFSQETDFDISLYSLSANHNIRPLVVRTLLTYLELEGYLKGSTPFYSTYRFKPLLKSQEILAHFQGERRHFIASIFRQSKKAKSWFDIDMEQTAQRLQSTRTRIIRALDYLHEKNMLEVKTSGIRHRYRNIKAPASTQTLATELTQRAHQREKNEIARIQQVLDLTNTNSCQTQFLAHHFGDNLKQVCGHCSWCLNGTKMEKPEQKIIPIDDALFQKALALREQNPTSLAEAQLFAQFLCGVASPRLSRARLTTHHLFGSLNRIPFRKILEHINTR